MTFIQGSQTSLTAATPQTIDDHAVRLRVLE